MRNIIVILLLASSCLTLSAQTIFDIQVDKIYIEDEDVLFVNQGELK